MMSAYGHETKKNGRMNLSKGLAIFMVILLIITLVVGLYFAFYKGRRDATTLQQAQFKQSLSKVCQQTPHPPLLYEGVNSVFEYLLQEPKLPCPVWTEIHGEENRSEMNNYSGRADRRQGTEGHLTRSEVMCINEDYVPSDTPCLVYSFGQSNQRNINGYFENLGCQLHVFDVKKQQDLEDTPYSPEHNISSLENTTNIADEDTPKNDSSNIDFRPIEEQPTNPEVLSRNNYKVSGRHARDVSVITSKDIDNEAPSQSLDEITSSLGHQGKTIRLLRVNGQGQEWPILRQLVAFHDLLDVQQVSAKIHIPRDVAIMTSAERHGFFADLYQIFEGLHCLGYKVIRSQPYPTRESDLYLPEFPEQGLPWSYQVNWMKIN